MAQLKELIVTGASRFLGNIYGNLKGNADTATKATQDSSGQQINTTYIKELSVSGTTITYKKGNGTTGTITTQDTNTDTKVTQSETTSSNFKPILFGATDTTNTSALAANTTAQSYVSTKLYAKPSAGELYATTFKGNLSGNASTASSAAKLTTAGTIDGVSFDGTAAIAHFGTCSTAAATAAKTVSLSGFSLVNGAEITVKFTVTNTASSPTLNVNGTGAKSIYYRGSAISATYLAANRTYRFSYDGTTWNLIGDINTDTNTKNTAGSTNTSSKIFLIGATSQSANPVTYSHDTAYVGTDGCLYSNSEKVATENTALLLTGGTLTGNLTGQYLTGTWLQTTDATDLGSTPPYIAVLDKSGWIYKRTLAELKSDIGAATTTVYSATIGTTWTGSAAPYSQTITVSGILANDTPIVDVNLSGVNYSNKDAVIEAYAKVYRITTAANSITVYADEKTSTKIPIQLKVVR